MENMVVELHEMCETLGRALKEANEKVRTSGGKLSASDMDYVNKLSHALKSVITTAAMKEAEEEEGGSYGSYGGGSYRRRYSRDGRGSYDGSYDGGSYADSYARGRGRNARRDSMGRYSRDSYSREDGYSREGGYSGHAEMVEELRMLMEEAPDQQTRQEFERLIQKMEKR